MTFLSNLKLGHRLTLAFGLVLALTITLGATAVSAMRNINERMLYVTENSVPALQALGDIKSQSLNLRRLEYNHLVSEDPTRMLALEAEIDKLQAQLAQNFKAYEPLVTDDQERQLWQTAMADAQRYTSKWTAIKALSGQVGG
ncbi:MAG: MCP four helix bundle domain-containing protein, partial [Hydrogenophaga sp.]|uniref:MCP four helix bundle domain-containing protein n=1 Tax=Hydrogenophaga sp. TaxID=1904254 RepID=UPI003D9AEF88